MRPLDHLRSLGHLDAWRELNARVAEDLAAKRGDIKPPRTIWAYYDSAKVLLSHRLLPFLRRA